MAYCIKCKRSGAKISRTVQTGYSSKSSIIFYEQRQVCESCSNLMDNKELSIVKRKRTLYIIFISFALISYSKYIPKKLSSKLIKPNKTEIVNSKKCFNQRVWPYTKSQITLSIPYNSQVSIIDSENLKIQNWVKIEF